MCKISFIIPFFNRYALLKRAIESILSSSYKNIEIILVDDASNGESLSDFQCWLNQFPTIYYIRLEKNSGPGIARNRGLDYAHGEWIFFLDSDDIIYPHILPAFADYLSDHQNIDIIYFNSTAHRFSLNDNPIIKTFICSPHGSLPLEDIFTFANTAVLWHFCFHRQFLKKHNLQFKDLRYCEDACFILYAICDSEKISVCDKILYEHTTNADGGTFQSARFQAQNIDLLNMGRKEIYNTVKTIIVKKGTDKYIDSLSVLLSRILLYSFSGEEFCIHDEELLPCEKLALLNLHELLAKYTQDFSKKIYISPSHRSAKFMEYLIKKWNGKLAGFIDSNIDSAVSKNVSKTGFTVINPESYSKHDGFIFIFGYNAGQIENRLTALGLVNGKDFIQTMMM
jgi:glycosyltransferase involved in cell wall biosynthesis